MRSTQSIGTFDKPRSPKPSASSASAAAHNNILRIKPVMRCTALQVGGNQRAFVLITTRDQLEQHVGVTVGIG
jgi:hypothetical protein